MLIILGLVMVTVIGGIAGTVMALGAVLGEHDNHEVAYQSIRPRLIHRVRERVLLRWDTTRRLN